MSHKRVADDWEDDWEREASINDNKRQQQSNPYTRQADILNEQYNTLTELHNDLSQQLKELRYTLFELEQEENRLLNKSNQLYQTYCDALNSVILLVEKDRKGFLDDKTSYEHFIEQNNALSDQILLLLSKWKRKLKDDEQNKVESNKQKELDSWINAFKRTELERIDLSIQVEGYTARVQLLEKETAKLNTLPQIVSILEASTSTYVKTMKEISQKQEILERDSILPCLDRLAELKITSILQEKHLKTDYISLQSIIEDLQLAYKISLRQRAIQQLLTFIFDDEMQAKQNKLSILETLTEDLEGKIKTENKVKEKAVEKRYDAVLDLLQVNDLTAAVNKLEEMKHKEEEMNSKWADKLQDGLSTIKELNDIQSTLSSTIHSTNEERTSVAPKHYLNLQSELEFRIQELQASILALEKDIKDPENIAKFEQEKKQFSLFFTDAELFEHTFSEKK